MGVYDQLPRGSQLKCWRGTMEIRHVGDNVPDLGLDEYIVLLREGGYVMVETIGSGWGIITKIVENYGRKLYVPEDFPGVTCVDKWGAIVESGDDLIGAFDGVMGMNDPYYSERK